MLPDTIVSSVEIPFGTIVNILIAAIVVGIVAAVGPARRAAKLDVLESISAQ